MGTWAAGNFDSDGALDYVGSVIDRLVARINETFGDEDMARLDEDGEADRPGRREGVVEGGDRAVRPRHHGDACKAAPPRPSIVSSWKTRYLAIFDEQIGELDPAEGYAAERRGVIDTTFTRLEMQARSFWREG